jgi:hypothetical protein
MENEVKNPFTYDKLEFLKKHAKLKLSDWLAVRKERRKEDRFVDAYRK